MFLKSESTFLDQDRFSQTTIRGKIIKLAQNPRLQGLSIIILVALSIFLLIQTYGKIYRPEGNDFTNYLLASKLVLQGKSPYMIQGESPFAAYPYPLFLAFIMIPLTVWPLWAAGFLWFTLNLFALFYSTYLFLYLTFNNIFSDKKTVFVLLVCLLILLLNIIQNNLLNGQVNFLVLFLCLLFLSFYEKEKNIAASIFLALSISIKLLPLIFIFFLLYRREIKMLGYTILFTTLFCLAPFLTMGFHLFTSYQSYFQALIFNSQEMASRLSYHDMYFTITGFITSVFPNMNNTAFLNILSCFIVLFGLFLFEWISKSLPKRNVLVFPLYLLAILFVNPVSETHHLIFIVPAISFTFLYLLFYNTSCDWLQWILVGSFWGFFYLGKFFKEGPYLFLSLLILLSLFLKLVLSIQKGNIKHSIA